MVSLISLGYFMGIFSPNFLKGTNFCIACVIMLFSISVISEGFLLFNKLYQSYCARYQLIALYFPFLNNNTFLFSLDVIFSIGKTNSNTIGL
ncbi:unnamed protein product [Meloidogyne enterolobii]|uniref:Uncharacterized protein n=1 Tax=Meloidogyne enterolobii TaxID=390850 RepID=A0ACB0XST4_MELEN